MSFATLARWTLLGIPLKEASFERRGFHLGALETRRRLEQVSRTFVVGCNLAYDDSDPDRLEQTLGFIDPDSRGFAYEGAAMGVSVLDLMPRAGNHRLAALMSGPGAPHLYLCHVGAGIAAAAVGKDLDRLIDQGTSWCRWLMFNGAGFYRTYFHRHSAVERVSPAATRWDAGRWQFDAGAGRALWFRCCGDPDVLARTVSRYAPGRRPALWEGVGLACAYAGGVSAATISEVAVRAGDMLPSLAAGVAMAINTRALGGNLGANQELVAKLVWHESADEIHRLVEETRVEVAEAPHGLVAGRPGLEVLLEAVMGAAERLRAAPTRLGAAAGHRS